MISSTQKNEVKILTEAETAVIRALAYFKIFSYPLSSHEIWLYSNVKCDESLIDTSLESLVNCNLVYKLNNYFYLANDLSLVERRNKGNKLALKLLPKGKLRARFIQRFPYVQAVFISGTLSKNYMDDESDIDFFIVTKAKRMWIARTFLVLFKKIVLLNSSKFFCLNYFIDEESIAITDQNQFTATELATLIPVTNSAILSQFNDANKWLFNFYPNQVNSIKTKQAVNVKDGLFKKFFEFCLNNKFGDWLNNYLMQLTKKFWKKKFKALPKKDFDIGLKSTETVSKHHPKNYQDRVKEALAANLLDFEQQNNVKLLV